MTSRDLSILSAFLISLFAADTLTFFTDVFSLPLPRFFWGFSASVFFGVADVFLLWPVASRMKVPMASRFDLIGFGILGVWIAIECLLGLMGHTVGLEFAISFVPLLFMASLVRLHGALFSGFSVLTKAFTFVVVSLVVVHSALLGLAALDINLSFINFRELYDRNGLTTFLVIALWLCVVVGKRPAKILNPTYVFLALLSAIYAAFNHARTTDLLLLMTMLLACSRQYDPKYQDRWKWLLGLSALVVLLVSFSYQVVQFLDSFSLLGKGDALISSRSRSLTNLMLLTKFADSPLFGVGSAEVFKTKALGYMSHTLYLIVLSAYGLAGLFFLPFLSFAARSWDRARKWRVSAMLLLLSLTASFFNDPFPLYGLIIVLVNEGYGRAGGAKNEQ